MFLAPHMLGCGQAKSLAAGPVGLAVAYEVVVCGVPRLPRPQPGYDQPNGANLCGWALSSFAHIAINHLESVRRGMVLEQIAAGLIAP